MTVEAIKYDGSLFEDILSYPIYKTQNVVCLKRCLKDVEKERVKWQKMDSDFGMDEQQYSISPLENLATNHLAMTYILNRLNEILKFLKTRGFDFMETKDGNISTDQLDFMTNHITNKEGFESEYKRFHSLLHCFKDNILKEGSKIYNKILEILSQKIEINTDEHIVLKNLQQFFPRATDIKAIENMTDSDDEVVTDFIYRGNPWKMRIVPATKIERDGEYWKIWSNKTCISKDEHFVAFVLPNYYVYLFDNDMSKIRDLSMTDIFDKTLEAGLTFLFHREILIDYRKL